MCMYNIIIAKVYLLSHRNLYDITIKTKFFYFIKIANTTFMPTLYQ